MTMAAAYIDLGDDDRTFEWLGKAYQERSPGLYVIACDPYFDRLHSYPRFQDLLRRLNLSGRSARAASSAAKPSVF